jgi:hypothetical protein
MILYLVFGLLALALGVAAAGFLIVLLATGTVSIRVAVLTCLLISAGVGMLVRWRTLLGAKVIAFERGLARLRGVRCEVMRWQDIAAVERGTAPQNNQFTITTPARLALRSGDGREWVFTEALQGLKDLRALVEERTLPHLIPAALAALQSGKTLSFGLIGVKQEGLTYPRMGILAWDLVSAADISQGTVVIGSRLLNQAYCAEPLYRVPNAHVLMGLIDRQGKA